MSQTTEEMIQQDTTTASTTASVNVELASQGDSSKDAPKQATEPAPTTPSSSLEHMKSQNNVEESASSIETNHDKNEETSHKESTKALTSSTNEQMSYAKNAEVKTFAQDGQEATLFTTGNEPSTSVEVKSQNGESPRGDNQDTSKGEASNDAANHNDAEQRDTTEVKVSSRETENVAVEENCDAEISLVTENVAEDDEKSEVQENALEERQLLTTATDEDKDSQSHDTNADLQTEAELASESEKQSNDTDVTIQEEFPSNSEVQENTPEEKQRLTTATDEDEDSQSHDTNVDLQTEAEVSSESEKLSNDTDVKAQVRCLSKDSTMADTSIVSEENAPIEQNISAIVEKTANPFEEDQVSSDEGHGMDATQSQEQKNDLSSDLKDASEQEMQPISTNDKAHPHEDEKSEARQDGGLLSEKPTTDIHSPRDTPTEDLPAHVDDTPAKDDAGEAFSKSSHLEKRPSKEPSISMHSEEADEESIEPQNSQNGQVENSEDEGLEASSKSNEEDTVSSPKSNESTPIPEKTVRFGDHVTHLVEQQTDISDPSKQSECISDEEADDGEAQPFDDMVPPVVKTKKYSELPHESRIKLLQKKRMHLMKLENQKKRVLSEAQQRLEQLELERKALELQEREEHEKLKKIKEEKKKQDEAAGVFLTLEGDELLDEETFICLIAYQDRKVKCQFTGIKNAFDLREKVLVAHDLTLEKMQKYEIEYWDPDFEEFVPLNALQAIPHKLRIQIKLRRKGRDSSLSRRYRSPKKNSIKSKLFEETHVMQIRKRDMIQSRKDKSRPVKNATITRATSPKKRNRKDFTDSPYFQTVTAIPKSLRRPRSPTKKSPVKKRTSKKAKVSLSTS